MGSVNVGGLTSSLLFGDSYGSFEVEPNGTVVLNGDATVWKSYRTALISKRLNSNNGKLDYNFKNGSIKMQKNGDINNDKDVLIFSYDVPNEAKENSTMRLYLKWEQDVTLLREITVEYRIQNDGEAKTTAWNTHTVQLGTSSTNLYPYTSGTINQSTRLAEVPLTGHNMHSKIQFRICRTDSTAGNLQATDIEALFEVDSFGSRSEFNK